MTEKKRFVEDYSYLVNYDKYCILDKVQHKHLYLDEVIDLLNELDEENMDLRAKHTQMILIMKDVVKDLKRIDTYRYAEHLEKIANLHFLSEKEYRR